MIGRASGALLLGAILLCLAPAVMANPYSKDKKVTYFERAVAMPRAAAGAIAGITVGVPVRIGHDIKEQTITMQRVVDSDMSGGESDLTSKVMSTMVAVPYGLVSGMIMGTIKGVEKGVSAGVSRPFSRESFSLEEGN